MVGIKIEVRCKGIFAYLKGNNGKRWLAMPKTTHHGPAQDEHLCQLQVLKSAIAAGNPDFTDESLSIVPLGDYVRFKGSLKGLEIVGATIGPIKPEFSSPIPSNGLPTNPSEDSAWASQKFIASLTDFFPGMVSDITEAEFLMPLPDTTEWHGLAPSDFTVRKCLWQFVKESDETAVVTKKQALTDVVGFFLIVPPKTTLRVETATGVVTVPVNFAEGPQSQLKLIAGPMLADSPEAGKVLKHFGHLYHLSKPAPPVKVLPKCLGPLTSVAGAGDIFCPGGEGEGEGGG